MASAGSTAGRVGPSDPPSTGKQQRKSEGKREEGRENKEIRGKRVSGLKLHSTVYIMLMCCL